MRIQTQADTFARRIAGMGWRDGVHTSEANTPDGQRLMVRHPWEENPHYEWQHHHGQGRPVTGIASSLPEAKAQAEQSHKDLSGAWDPDAEQEALDPRLLGAAARFARQYFADTDGLDDVPLASGEGKKKKDPDVEAGSPVAGGTPTGLNDPSKTDALPPPSSHPPGQYVHVGPMGGGGGGMPSGSMGGASGGSSAHPDGGPPSASLGEALGRAGIDPAMHPLISGFSATEGNNPSGVPTLGFTDSQAGTSLDDHAQALAKQLQDRQSVAGPFPHGGSPADQASWMATVVGQNGSPSDWQGNAQPSRSDYVNRVVQNMPEAAAPLAGG